MPRTPVSHHGRLAAGASLERASDTSPWREGAWVGVSLRRKEDSEQLSYFMCVKTVTLLNICRLISFLKTQTLVGVLETGCVPRLGCGEPLPALRMRLVDLRDRPGPASPGPGSQRARGETPSAQ